MNPQQQQLTTLQPTKKFFVGIDSDGCAFDTMEIKHKECFCPNVVHHWELQTISKYVREAWEFVNLYSKTRGANRFHTLIESFRLLSERQEVKARDIVLPDITPLIEWTRKETQLGNPVLEAYAREANNPIIDQALKWSVAVNQTVREMVYGIAPFPLVRECLELLNEKADAIVISQTPVEALEREWKENNISKYVRVIAGQEYGTKTEHLAMAAKNKYPDNHILMIGDAPGDMKAAKNNGVLFFPINPGQEELSWKSLHLEGLDKFFTGQYEGSYEKMLIEEFNSYLPEIPPWKK
ncbi:MAG: HAD family hydrolase [Bacteroidetes bacterium]|jgi:phosphoglycolate phosphatase-like HAD superfamily hydrolase|nr:HAD family hydrolase [Bacteroidota bacterium]MBT3750800.1 HAD family hydrolase [Bacteroidota bacterium]MBT4399882.1 HAD family hydrolase [Bacteroidota bacterium]MBT4409854.1 HAD family hydrolase [Bacteroidota bacterium]MBT5427227.1 HAD family hydrolase [Bacteroidota bacterium]